MTTDNSAAGTLAATVRQRRLELGLTQAALAARIGVPTSTYVKFERSGVTTLARLLRIVDGVGLALTLAPTGGMPVADPRLRRQRGLRTKRTSTAAGNAKAAATAQTSSTPARVAGTKRASTRKGATSTARASASAGAVAEVLKKYRYPIALLVRDIVDNRLTNGTAGAVVRNVMNAQRDLAPNARPAFVAAVEGELERIDATNLAEFAIDAARFRAWSGGWDPGQGIVGALD